MKSHAPIKTKCVRSGNVPWITSDVREGVHDRDVTERKSNHSHDWAVYKRLRKKINGEIESSKAIMLMRLSGLMVTRVKPGKLTSRQKNNVSVKELKLNENSVINSHELSNTFNDHFSTIGTKLVNEVPLVTDGSSHADYIVSCNKKFFFSPISGSNVFPQ